MKAVVAAFNQEKALVGAFSVITNIRMDLFEALVLTLTLWHAATPRAPSRQFLWRAAGWRVTPAHVSCFYTPVTNTRCSHKVDRGSPVNGCTNLQKHWASVSISECHQTQNTSSISIVDMKINNKSKSRSRDFPYITNQYNQKIASESINPNWRGLRL